MQSDQTQPSPPTSYRVFHRNLFKLPSCTPFCLVYWYSLPPPALSIPENALFPFSCVQQSWLTAMSFHIAGHVPYDTSLQVLGRMDSDGNGQIPFP